VHEEGLDHEAPMPAVPDPETLPDFQTRMAPYAEAMGPWYQRPRPIDTRHVDQSPPDRKEPLPPFQQVWLRADGSLPDDPVLHACVLTYASDMTLLDTALRPHGGSWHDEDLFMASLDHTMWFHRPFRADDRDAWLRAFYREIDDLMRAGHKLVVHGEELGDRLVGIMGGYIRWAGLFEDSTKAIAMTERLTGRQLDPFGFGARQSPHVAGEPQVFQHAECIEKPEMLRHRSAHAAYFERLASHVEPAHVRGAARRFQQSREHLHGGGLARAIGPQERADLAGGNREVERGDGQLFTEPAREAGAFDHRSPCETEPLKKRCP